MKTISRILFSIALCIGTCTYAQPSGPTALTDLQNQLQYLQNVEAAIQNEIAMSQADLISQQDLVASLDIQIADETAAGNDVTAMQAERTQALDLIAALQQTIAIKQIELADIQSQIAGYNDQIQTLLHDKTWLSTYMSSSGSFSTFQNPQQVPNPVNPNATIGVLPYTGNAQQDAQIIQEWLRQHGLLDSPVDSQ